MDDFTGQILDELDTLGLADDTIVVWASDNGADSTYREPAGDPDPFGGVWNGFSGPWRGSLFTSLEGSNRNLVHRPLAGQGARGQGQQRDGA
jgi:arylsulfatase A-like enzyme